MAVVTRNDITHTPGEIPQECLAVNVIMMLLGAEIGWKTIHMNDLGYTEDRNKPQPEFCPLPPLFPLLRPHSPQTDRGSEKMMLSLNAKTRIKRRWCIGGGKLKSCHSMQTWITNMFAYAVQ